MKRKSITSIIEDEEKNPKERKESKLPVDAENTIMEDADAEVDESVPGMYSHNKIGFSVLWGEEVFRLSF